MVHFSSDQIPVTNTRSQGVKGIKLAAGDVCAGACVAKSHDNAIWVQSETGSMKRVKTEEITLGNRAIKGELICKKQKSNPSHIKEIRAVTPYDQLVFVTSEEVKTLMAKDVAIMNRVATFSNTITFKGDFYSVQDIEECRIVDIPEGAELVDESEDVEQRVHGDFEMMDLFNQE